MLIENLNKREETFNILGDIEGCSSWRELINTDAINKFVGDYFDPSARYTQAQAIREFNDIIELKIKKTEISSFYMEITTLHILCIPVVKKFFMGWLTVLRIII